MLLYTIFLLHAHNQPTNLWLVFVSICLFSLFLIFVLNYFSSLHMYAVCRRRRRLRLFFPFSFLLFYLIHYLFYGSLLCVNFLITIFLRLP